MSISVRFMRRRNLGNFEHTELEIVDSVEKKEDLKQSIDGIMGLVKDALFHTGVFKTIGSEATNVEVVNAPTTSVAKTAATTSVRKTPAETKVAETKVAETKVAEVKAEETKVEETKPEVKAEEKKVEEKKEAKKETVTKTKTSKVTAYDRNLDPHKNNLGTFLNAKFPNWRHKDNLKKAGEASRALQGTEFLDNDGNILESFKEAFSKYMVDLV